MQGGIPIPEAAHALGISERTVRRRIKDGTLDAYEVHTVHGMAWRVVLPVVQGRPGGGNDDPAAASTALATVDNRLDGARLRVVVEELQRTRERVAALEALLPEYGPRDPGPPVVLPREIIAYEDSSTVVVQSDDSRGIWARLWAWLGGGA